MVAKNHIIKKNTNTHIDQNAQQHIIVKKVKVHGTDGTNKNQTAKKKETQCGRSVWGKKKREINAFSEPKKASPSAQKEHAKSVKKEHGQHTFELRECLQKHKNRNTETSP